VRRRQDAKWCAGVRVAATAVALLALACSEPRARPVPPDIELAFDTAQAIHSPGTLTGTVNVHASGGLDLLHIRLSTADSVFVLDTLEGYAGEQDLARAVTWEISPGLPVGTTLSFTVKARDFIGFETADSTSFKTQ
jgi:hypothetical protein